MSTDVSRLRELPAMDYPTARRLAQQAVAGDGTVVIGRRVVASLLAQIDALAGERDELAAMLGTAHARIDRYEAAGRELVRQLPTLAGVRAQQPGWPT